MKIAREGYPFAAAGLLLAGVCWAGVLAGFGDAGSWMARGLLVAASLLSILAVFVLWFFRDPEPTLPAEVDAVVAPGEGRIIVVDDVEEPTVLKGRATKISIFLSVFDVHVQRAPVSGEVVHRDHHPGTYVAAWADEASAKNERASLGIATEQGPVLVRQIAGLVARRIVTDPSVGDRVQRGRRFGLIRFGSRVDLFIPLHWEVLCKVGDRVRSGATPIARQRSTATVGSPSSASQDDRSADTEREGDVTARHADGQTGRRDDREAGQ